MTSIGFFYCLCITCTFCISCISYFLVSYCHFGEIKFIYIAVTLLVRHCCQTDVKHGTGHHGGRCDRQTDGQRDRGTEGQVGMRVVDKCTAISRQLHADQSHRSAVNAVALSMHRNAGLRRADALQSVTDCPPPP